VDHRRGQRPGADVVAVEGDVELAERDLVVEQVVQQSVDATGNLGALTFTLFSGAATDLAIPEANKVSIGVFHATATVNYVAIIESTP